MKRKLKRNSKLLQILKKNKKTTKIKRNSKPSTRIKADSEPQAVSITQKIESGEAFSPMPAVVSIMISLSKLTKLNYCEKEPISSAFSRTNSQYSGW